MDKKQAAELVLKAAKARGIKADTEFSPALRLVAQFYNQHRGGDFDHEEIVTGFLNDLRRLLMPIKKKVPIFVWTAIEYIATIGADRRILPYLQSIMRDLKRASDRTRQR